jgi:uncharacterized protein (TIGR00288 family)
MSQDKPRTLAVFIDFENLVLGLKDRHERFNVDRVLSRLLERGYIVVKRAYADWRRFAPYADGMHESAIELIEVPARRMTGKNSADIRLCVDALDLSYSKPHIDTFVILSGDSDFSPLVSKLRENNKHVIGVGTKGSTSALLRDNCDEFIYYEDLVPQGRARAQSQAPASASTPVVVVPAPVPTPVAAAVPAAADKQPEAMGILVEALQTLQSEKRERFWSSLIKTAIRRRHPSFEESSYGYRGFDRMLEDAAAKGLVTLERDAANRTYIVKDFKAGDVQVVESVPAVEEAKPAARKPARRRPRRRTRKPAAAKA